MKVDLLFERDQVSLYPSMAFSCRTDLLGEHTQASFFIIALLTDGRQALTTFAEVGLQLCLLAGH